MSDILYKIIRWRLCLYRVKTRYHTGCCCTEKCYSVHVLKVSFTCFPADTSQNNSSPEASLL